MATPTIHPALREVIEQLAPLERAPGSAGEARLPPGSRSACAMPAATPRSRPPSIHDGYAKPIGTLAAVTALAGVLALQRAAAAWPAA